MSSSLTHLVNYRRRKSDVSESEVAVKCCNLSKFMTLITPMIFYVLTFRFRIRFPNFSFFLPWNGKFVCGVKANTLYKDCRCFSNWEQMRLSERVEIALEETYLDVAYRVCRRSRRCGRTISPVGIRSIRRGVLWLSQYGETSAIIIGIVRISIELRITHC